MRKCRPRPLQPLCPMNTDPRTQRTDTARRPIKITIATVTYNAEDTLARTMQSVAEQDYAHVEHLVVDGNSQDGTLAVFHHFQELNSNATVPHELACCSENDEGLYDAMNKALRLATGDYICFLNAGDRLHAPNTLSLIASQAAGRPAVVYGDTDLVDDAGHFLRHRRLHPDAHTTWRSFKNGMLICHQSFYARTDLARATPYDRRYRFSADYDWCIRVMQRAARHHLALRYVHAVVADYLSEGLTTQNHRRSLFERFCIMARHYGWLTAVTRHLWFVVRARIKK